MAAVALDYLSATQSAVLSPAAGCEPIAWSMVRRLFEERYPDLVENRHDQLLVPWWTFLALRDSLRYVLRANGVTSIDVSRDAGRRLEEARERASSYDRALSSFGTLPAEQIGSRLEAAGFVRSLLPYQVANVARLCGLTAGATFSVPGSGKTTEALAFFFLNRTASDRLLVIAPKNAFIAWEDELELCAPGCGFSFARLTGGHSRIDEILSADPPAVIISYQQLPRALNEVAGYLDRNAAFVFVDESHRMKRGVSGVQGSSVLGISHLPKRKLILSGTPMPNSPDDLVAQFTFLYPEFATRADEVIEKFRPVFVRTTKSQLGLKAPRRVMEAVPMRPAQERLYRALATEAGRHTDGLTAQDRIRLRRFRQCVQHLLQAASNPALLAATPLADSSLLAEAIEEGVSAKLDRACSLVRKWVREGQKVVVWSTFVQTVEHLASLLADVGAMYIHGGVGTSEDPDAFDTREARIRDFNNPDSPCRVLVANPAACSEGISLHHVCHRALYIDRNYNAANYLQSEDRIHRIGLPEGTETDIVILVSPDTIDQSVDRRLQSKVNTMAIILDDPDLNIRPLDLDADEDVDGIDVDDIEDIRAMLRDVT